MAEINKKLLDKIIGFQVDLRRLNAGERRKIINVLKDVEKGIKAELSEGELIEFGKKKIESVITRLSEPISQAYQEIHESTQGMLDDLVELQLKVSAKDFESVFVGMGASLPPAVVINRLTKDLIVQGNPLNDWWSKQEADTIFKMSSQIRTGIVSGETNQQIIRRLIGTRTTPGVITVARNNASAIVHTAIQTVSNDAQQAFYQANDDIIKSVVWFTAMDSRVCPLCMSRSGSEWSNDADHRIIKGNQAYAVPPIHINDRCILLPQTVTFKELGIDLPEPPVGTRASSLGPIKADTTFKEYLEMVDKDQQDKMLGKGRAELFRDGKISLNQLLDGNGRELTLAELKAKYN